MSQRNSGYERKKLDFYATPAWVTQSLLGEILTRPGSIWEPACGDGQMVQVLKDHFLVMATDVANDGTDFLATKTLPALGIRGIVTNPPYHDAEKFCSHALDLVAPVKGFVAMLLRCDFDHAKSRFHIFRDCAAWSRKLILTKRIVWFVEANGKPKASPSFNHAWYIWDWQHKGPPTIAYA